MAGTGQGAFGHGAGTQHGYGIQPLGRPADRRAEPAHERPRDSFGYDLRAQRVVVRRAERRAVRSGSMVDQSAGSRSVARRPAGSHGVQPDQALYGLVPYRSGRGARNRSDRGLCRRNGTVGRVPDPALRAGYHMVRRFRHRLCIAGRGIRSRARTAFRAGSLGSPGRYRDQHRTPYDKRLCRRRSGNLLRRWRTVLGRSRPVRRSADLSAHALHASEPVADRSLVRHHERTGKRMLRSFRHSRPARSVPVEQGFCANERALGQLNAHLTLGLHQNRESAVNVAVADNDGKFVGRADDLGDIDVIPRQFLENVIDWGISRDRYWGTPLPVWKCECGHEECIGSIAELKEKAIDCPDEIELHKPYIDNVHLKCPECGKTMTRFKEVIDCWFDSGSMPFAQLHYPFENKEEFEKHFPAQFISEAIDQTRGWFYTLLAVSTCLFDKTPYENCIVLGHVLDEKGQKMSKSKGNGVDPMVLLDQVGADATRWHFYTCSAPWLPTRLGLNNVQETQRGFLSTLWNVYSFYVLYAEIDQFNPNKYADFKSENIMDKWILSKLNTLIKEVAEKLDKYDITSAALQIEDFTDELSNWYVRTNRERFWGEELTDDKIGAYTTLYKVLVNLIKISAPFVPFMTDEIYQNLVVGLDKKAPESVHLCLWPEVDEKAIDKKLENEMDLAYSLVKLGRSARNSANIKNRQPLSKMLISVDTLPEYYGNIVKEELNVKEVDLGANMNEYVHFEIKPNLPVLGKEYGKLIPKIREAISKLNQMDLANKVKNGGVEYIEIDGTQIELTSENLLVTMQGKEGFAFAGEGEIGVVLDTTITPELKEEGYVREILSKVQNMRKDKGFEVLDKINLYVSENEMLEELVKKFESEIKKETLTENIVFNTQRNTYTEVSINGEKLMLDVEVVK